MVRELGVVLISGLALGALADDVSSQQGDESRVRVRRLSEPQVLPTPVPRGEIGRPDVHGASGARPAVLLTGYWPPTNEMLRRFSPDPIQNPNGWIGDNWEERGYDVYSFFPEFTPPNCGMCGKGTGDLEVDYQDTSADFWPIADGLDPIAVITFSRGNPDASWEIEMNQFNRTTWIGDYLSPFEPEPSPPDTSVPPETLRPSTLPVEAILASVDEVAGIDPFICFSGDGGGFLSEFIGYHGVWYQDIHAAPALQDWCVTAGHVHVGSEISIGRARLAAKATLRAVLTHVDVVVGDVTCQQDLGSGGPGEVHIALCGDPLGTGGLADFLLTGAPAFASTLLAVGLVNAPTPFKGGTLVPFPPQLVLTLHSDAEGSLALPGVSGGGGPLSVLVQAMVVDGAQTQGFAISNALQLELLP